MDQSQLKNGRIEFVQPIHNFIILTAFGLEDDFVAPLDEADWLSLWFLAVVAAVFRLLTLVAFFFPPPGDRIFFSVET